MRATRIKDALECPGCGELLDPEQDEMPAEEMTWTCPECDVATSDGPSVNVGCPKCSTVVMEQCSECEAWVEPVEWEDKAMCSKCEGWFLLGDFTEPDEAYRCGECDTAYQDRESAKECCR